VSIYGRQCRSSSAHGRTRRQEKPRVGAAGRTKAEKYMQSRKEWQEKSKNLYRETQAESRKEKRNGRKSRGGGRRAAAE